jgi:hypothetical protein
LEYPISHAPSEGWGCPCEILMAPIRPATFHSRGSAPFVAYCGLALLVSLLISGGVRAGLISGLRNAEAFLQAAGADVISKHLDIF